MNKAKLLYMGSAVFIFILSICFLTIFAPTGILLIDEGGIANIKNLLVWQTEEYFIYCDIAATIIIIISFSLSYYFSNKARLADTLKDGSLFKYKLIYLLAIFVYLASTINIIMQYSILKIF